MEPARTIIKAFGGEKEVARITGTSYTAPYRWQTSRESGGTGGRIPQKPASKLLAYARDHGIEITADDFFNVSAEAA